MKYLKYCEDDVIGTDQDHNFIARLEGQPKHGPTVICFKNPTSDATRMVYTGKNIYKEDESPIQYTWRYEASYNGHPAIIVNFSRIDTKYKTNNYVVCLESNNMARGGNFHNYTMLTNEYKLKDENNNRALNVFEGHLLTDYENITYYTLNNITLNRDYPLYITVPARYIKGAAYMNRTNIIPNEWEVRINVRPTIRGTTGQGYSNINDYDFTFRHTNHIPAQEYMSVKFPYINIYEL